MNPDQGIVILAFVVGALITALLASFYGVSGFAEIVVAAGALVVIGVVDAWAS